MANFIKNDFYAFEITDGESSRLPTIRLKRNMKLLITDYLSGDPTWDAYRQKLRDFPDTVLSDGNVPDWPEPPEDLPGLNLRN